MTLLDAAKLKGLKINKADGGEFACGCPGENDLEEMEKSQEQCDGDCVRCYARESVWRPIEPEQRIFDTGAVRDSAAGKGRYDLLPWNAIHALAQHCERGAEHYGEHNVDKGIPQKSLIDSACRHLRGYITGDGENYHLVAALWNIAWAVEQEVVRPEMVDIYARGPGAGKAV